MSVKFRRNADMIALEATQRSAEMGVAD